ncbi:MAG: hydrolase [Methylococcales bacterium]|nr:hydrolase [Methylococcales bacterium]
MLINSTFKPAWWLNNPHLQTLYPALLRKLPPPADIRRERLITPDADFVDIDWCGEGNQPLVILLHGLTGSSLSGYIKGLQCTLWAQGLRSVALNFRGCSGEYNHTARCYHSGETEDIHFLYQTLRQREPDTPFAAVGFSLGGNVLLKWLGEQGDKLSLVAAVAVSVPLVLSACATRLDNGFSKIYRANLLRELKQYIRDKHVYLAHLGKDHEAAKIAALGDLSGVNSFWQYDDRVVARLHGFADVSDYYQRASSRQFLKAITVNTLVIQAVDDPFMTSAVLPSADELSASVQMEVTRGGGHVGFIVGNNPLQPEYWLEQRITQFLQQTGGADWKAFD